MKRIKMIAIVVLISWSSASWAQGKIDGLISFEKTAYSFGKIPKEKPVTVEFTFSNPTNKPLIIEDATAECGCTKPEYPKRPVMPGQKGTIKVTYDAKEPGVFTKKVTVKLVNVAETKVLTIQGEVVK
jgi:hypothetical protein